MKKADFEQYCRMRQLVYKQLRTEDIIRELLESSAKLSKEVKMLDNPSSTKPVGTWKRIALEMENCLRRELEISSKAEFLNKRILLAIPITSGEQRTGAPSSEAVQPPIFEELLSFFREMEKVQVDILDNLTPIQKETE